MPTKSVDRLWVCSSSYARGKRKLSTCHKYPTSKGIVGMNPNEVVHDWVGRIEITQIVNRELEVYEEALGKRSACTTCEGEVGVQQGPVRTTSFVLQAVSIYLNPQKYVK